MDPERQREISRRGGRAAHRLGKAHEWTRTEARAAVRKRRQNAARRPVDGGLSVPSEPVDPGDRSPM
jgi:hypothetical protein